MAIEIEEINKHNINIHQLANLSVNLWPDFNDSEMLNYYETILESGINACFLLHEHQNYIGFIELSIRNDYVEGKV